MNGLNVVQVKILTLLCLKQTHPEEYKERVKKSTFQTRCDIMKTEIDESILLHGEIDIDEICERIFVKGYWTKTREEFKKALKENLSKIQTYSSPEIEKYQHLLQMAEQNVLQSEETLKLCKKEKQQADKLLKIAYSKLKSEVWKEILS